MGTIQIGMYSDAGMVRYTDISLKDCIRAAYGVRDFQVQGPEWLDNARFDITAKFPAGVREDQIPEMLQSPLAERFKLSIRHDRKKQPVYALTPGKDGPRLKPAEIRTNGQGPKMLGVDGRPRSMMMFRFLAGEARVTAPSATLANLTALLSRFTERPVVDMTGIPGQYDFDLTFAPETTRGLPTGDGPLADPDTPSEPAPSLLSQFRSTGSDSKPAKLRWNSSSSCTLKRLRRKTEIHNLFTFRRQQHGQARPTISQWSPPWRLRKISAMRS
jgi:uncharacterized protein (TIGR03435 family)